MPTADDRLEELITLAKTIIQGLSVQQDSLGVIKGRLAFIESELTKDLPPSKTAEVLKDLVGAVNELHDVMVPVANAILGEELEPEDEAEPKHGD